MEEQEQDMYWREKIAESRASGMTMQEWCSANGITLGRMKYWIRKLGVGIRKRRDSGPTAGAVTPTWVTVTGVEPSARESAMVVVRIGGVTMDVRTGFDPVLLAQVVRALETNGG